MVHTVGGVIPPGAIITEIVPLDKELVVEAKIQPRDVGHVRIGQPVTVKVTTYDFSRYGGITGELKDVSASTFLDEQGEPYYKGIVELDRNYVGKDPMHNRVMPGMTVQADIKTGKKTLFSYLLKPVYSSVSTAFRER
jgi:membrane fusion protein, adhesin transport system